MVDRFDADEVIPPRVGDVVSVEIICHVVSHRLGRVQVRLWPLSADFGNPRAGKGHFRDEWGVVRGRYRVGDSVNGTATSVDERNRWAAVRLDRSVRAVVRWTGELPVVGESRSCVIATLSDATRRVIVVQQTVARTPVTG